MMEKCDKNFKYQFDLNGGWFATIPKNNLECIPEEDFRIHLGEHFARGVLTRELLQDLYNCYIVE